MISPQRTTAMAAIAAVVLVTFGCGDGGPKDGTDATTETSRASGDPAIDPGDGGDYSLDVDPDDFVEIIDNPYLPLSPGSQWIYEGVGDEGETERIEVTVTDERRQVMGVSAHVVRDREYVDGDLVEDTYDWFAQDRDGNVWYFGEETAEYEDGEVISNAGSWEGGVDGALPGIVMPADPAVGDAYRQEFYRGEAEDMAQVAAIDATHSIGLGEYRDVLVTEEWTPLEPDVVEHKYYAPGVGMIDEQTVAGGEGGAELIEHTPREVGHTSQARFSTDGA